jgi:predicted transcriptional regulator
LNIDDLTDKDLILPILRILRDGEFHTKQEVETKMIQHFHFSTNETSKKYPSGPNILGVRVGSTLSHLRQEGLLEDEVPEDNRGVFRGIPPKVDGFLSVHDVKPMTMDDYVNVIDYFYRKYDGKAGAAKALGISTSAVTKYLTYSRLSEKVKKCIDNKEFSIAVVLKALKGLGDDEDSVDEDQLIATAKELTRLHRVPRRRRSKLCPNCSSKNIIYTMYGYPTGEFLKELDDGDGVINGVKTELGGCVIDEYSKKWTCDDCGHIWGRP